MPCRPPARRLMAMNNSTHAAAGGLYSFKSWYARRLAPVRRWLVAANVPPAVITMTGIGFGAGAGGVLALMRPGPAAGAAVAALLAARLACANLDGGVARDGDRATPFGSVLNELGDRMAELAVLAGCLALAPAAVVLAAAFAATLPSWVALAGAAAGLGRLQGGPGCPARAGRARLTVSGLAGPAAIMAGVLTLGGIGALASGNADVIRKWRTWMVSAPLVAGCLWLGTPGAVLLAAGLGVTGAVEYGRLARLRPGDSALIAATAVILPLVAWRMPAELSRVLAAALLAAALVPVIGGDTVAGARRAAAAVFGAGWLAALTGLVLLRAAALPLIMAVAVADVGAWCSGRLLGGPALSPLSPAKRWTGVAGGALAGSAALALAGAVSGPGVFTPVHVIAVIVGPPAGDLLESMVKRGAGAKDAGRWLPGFGGLLDRIDSLLVALALAVIL